MTHVKRWVYCLIVAAAVYASFALYGVLRPLGLDPVRSIFICGVYGIGFHTLIVFLLRNINFKVRPLS